MGHRPSPRRRGGRLKIAAMKTGTPPPRRCRPRAIRLAGAGAVMQGVEIDTTTSAGRMILGIFATLAGFERDLIRERNMAGLAAAGARGRKGGRKFALTKAQVRLAQPPWRMQAPPSQPLPQNSASGPSLAVATSMQTQTCESMETALSRLGVGSCTLRLQTPPATPTRTGKKPEPSHRTTHQPWRVKGV